MTHSERHKQPEHENCLTLTHRDIGASIVPMRSDEGLSIPLMAADAVALVESLAWKKVDMLGFSMGGELLAGLRIDCILKATLPEQAVSYNKF